MNYAYYPGCSMEASSAAYDVSARRVAEVLGLGLDEIEDWNCCGATEYFTLDRVVGHAVIARNLALIDQQHDQVVAPCSACYLNLKKTDLVMQEHPELREKIAASLEAGGLQYQPGRVRVRHLLDVLVTDVGEQRIREKVTRPLTGLRVAPYYGCQIVRPLNGFDDPEYPMKLDHLLGWLGATVVDYPVKAHCCGGHMSQISEPQAYELIRRLLHNAEEYGAAAIACLCPMCQLNLDAYQGRVNRFFHEQFDIPILFFTQLVGLAFGLEPDALGFGRELVPATALVEQAVSGGGEPVAAAAEAQPARTGRRKDSPELPMPRLDDGEMRDG